MKFCPICGSSVADEATFCPACGTALGAAPQQDAAPKKNYSSAPNFGAYATGYSNYTPVPTAAPARPAEDPTDHTKEFEAKDISDNKVICMLIYLAGYLGILVALLMANTSKYVSFHVRQALKIEVTGILWTVATLVYQIAVALITVIFGAISFEVGLVFGSLLELVPVAGAVALLVIKVLCFVQICRGQAKEPILISKLNFLK